MSQENVDVVRRGLEAFDRGELSEVLAVMAEDLEWLPPSYVLDGVSYSGHEGYAAWFEGLDNTWSRLDLAWTLSDPGGKQVIGQFRGEFVGRESGTSIHQRFWIVYWLGSGKITRGQAFLSEADALEAVGLREQVTPQGNLDVARRWIEAYNRGDVEALLALTHPNFEFRTSGAFPDLDPVYQGHAGFQRFYGDFTATWESFTVSVDELREVAPRALLLGMFQGRGRDGVQVRRQTASVWTFREGLVFRIWNYEGWRQAVNAAGGVWGPYPGVADQRG